jgi:hypothetical protein
MTVRVKLNEDFNGYSAGSKVTMTEKAYFRHKAAGVKLALIGGTDPMLEVENKEEWNEVKEYYNDFKEEEE